MNKSLSYGLAEVCDIHPEDIAFSLQVSERVWGYSEEITKVLGGIKSNLTNFFVNESDFPEEIFDFDETIPKIKKKSSQIYIEVTSTQRVNYVTRGFLVFLKPKVENENDILIQFRHPTNGESVTLKFSQKELVDFLSSYEDYYGEITSAFKKRFAITVIEEFLSREMKAGIQELDFSDFEFAVRGL